VGIFKGFERSAASGSLPGGGVGLALVKAFIELQGGSVEIASKPNQGTTVSLFFPDKLIV
jgi:signal transduction histidine kinase